MDARETHEVDPARLVESRWSEEFNKQVASGDVAAAYSGDLIAAQSTIRAPFVFEGEAWVTVSLTGGQASAYRPVDVDALTEADYEAPQNPANGAYHGMTVRYHNEWFVLNGPPARFVPATVVQPGLFGD